MNTRMRRMKLNRGGDGVSHHRSTTERVGTDKCICRANLSDVRFRSRNRPPLSDFVRIIRKESVQICGICGEEKEFFLRCAMKAAKPSCLCCISCF